MNRTDAPKKQAIPFAVNGQREDLLSTTPAGDNQASYDSGFPPVTMILKAAGGKPPKGQDMNQILYELASVARWAGAGAGYTFDSAFATTVGGYPVGAKVLSSDGAGYWINTSESNASNPEVANGSLTGWVPAGFYGVTSITGLDSSNITLTSLQAARDRIELSGTLTANINIVVPAWRKSWTIVNNTTGAFTVAIKTPSGTGVSIAAGKKAKVYGDSVNIIDIGYLQAANNLSEIAAAGSAAQSSSRGNLGLGSSSVANVGTAAGTVAAGNDSRFSQIIGVGQAWTDMTASRSAGVLYTNNTGRPIQVGVYVAYTHTSPHAWWIEIDGVSIASSVGGANAIIPTGSTYKLTLFSSATLVKWLELR